MQLKNIDTKLKEYIKKNSISKNLLLFLTESDTVKKEDVVKDILQDINNIDLKDIIDTDYLTADIISDYISQSLVYNKPFIKGWFLYLYWMIEDNPTKAIKVAYYYLLQNIIFNIYSINNTYILIEQKVSKKTYKDLFVIIFFSILISASISYGFYYYFWQFFS